jgi:hypothetical protein
LALEELGGRSALLTARRVGLSSVGRWIVPLEMESKYYAEHKAELLASYEGQFVLVRGSELAGAFTTDREAYEAGLKRYGNEPFLIRRVQRQEDELAHYPALVLGVLYAHA